MVAVAANYDVLSREDAASSRRMPQFSHSPITRARCLRLFSTTTVLIIMVILKEIDLIEKRAPLPFEVASGQKCIDVIGFASELKNPRSSSGFWHRSARNASFRPRAAESHSHADSFIVPHISRPHRQVKISSWTQNPA